MKGSNGRARLLAGTAAVVVLAVVAAAVVLVVGRSQAAPRPVALPSFTPHPAATVMNAQVRQRVVQILTEMHRKAFNPDAPPPKSSSGLTGGLFINWSASWDGNLGSAVANTNYQSNGKTDSESGAAPRHDPFTDLVYLRNLLGYRAANPSDHSFDGDIALMAPIVKSDFANYSYYKCNLYDELEDMQSFDPGGGWGAMADGFAAIVYTKFYDPALGTVVGGSDGSYRVDYAAACAVAMADSGTRRHDQAMLAAGIATAQHVMHDVDPDTRLLPLQVMAAGAPQLDTVVQKQVKMGEEAQTLDALLDMYELTHDSAYLSVVRSAVSWMYSSPLYDRRDGGFYFSIDYDGTQLQNSYKESRQAWMLALLEHLERLQPGHWSSQVQGMLAVVTDKLWSAASDGYVYRVTPQFTVYVNHEGPGHTEVTESWVTSEAMDIACQVLENPIPG